MAPKTTCSTRWQIPLPEGINRLQAAHGLVFGTGTAGAIHAWDAATGTLRFSRGETGMVCEGFAVVGDTLLVVWAKRVKGEQWSKTAFAFEATTGVEHGRAELKLDGLAGTMCVTGTPSLVWVAPSKSPDLLGLDAQAEETAVIGLSAGEGVTNLLPAGELVVAMTTPHQGLRGFDAQSAQVFSFDGAMPLAWSPHGLVISVNGEVRFVDVVTGLARWTQAFDLSARMAISESLVVAVDHLGLVHALDATTGATTWTTASGGKKGTPLNPVFAAGYAWLVNAAGKLVGLDPADGRKAFLPTDSFATTRALLAGEDLLLAHRVTDGHHTLTALQVTG